jgi:DNA-directed RNA polymerase specialized sigma24 family protein
MNLFRSRHRRVVRQLRRLGEEPPDELADAERRHDVETASLRLSPRQRAAVALTEFVGLTSSEAAAVLGVRPATARNLSMQARTAVRRRLEEQDG